MTKVAGSESFSQRHATLVETYITEFKCHTVSRCIKSSHLPRQNLREGCGAGRWRSGRVWSGGTPPGTRVPTAAEIPAPAATAADATASRSLHVIRQSVYTVRLFISVSWSLFLIEHVDANTEGNFLKSP
jgi:hypothetical protein